MQCNRIFKGHIKSKARINFFHFWRCYRRETRGLEGLKALSELNLCSKKKSSTSAYPAFLSSCFLECSVSIKWIKGMTHYPAKLSVCAYDTKSILRISIFLWNVNMPQSTGPQVCSGTATSVFLFLQFARGHALLDLHTDQSKLPLKSLQMVVVLPSVTNFTLYIRNADCPFKQDKDAACLMSCYRCPYQNKDISLYFFSFNF